MRGRIVLGTALLILSALHLAPGAARAGAVLDRVKASDSLACGLVTEPEDYDKADVHAALPALGRDICRAVSAAVLGSGAKAKFVDLPIERNGFKALGDGRIDLLVGATPSTAASVAFGVSFGPPIFLDGDGLLVNRGAGIDSFSALANRTVCYVPGTESAAVLDSEAARRHVKVLPWPFEEHGELLAAVTGGRCDALFGSVSRLVTARAGLHGRNEFDLLQDRFSMVPFSPTFATGDAAWAEVIGGVVDALVMAERGGVTRATAASLRDTEDPLLRGLHGTLTGIDSAVIDPDWAVRVIGLVGNYGELYERDLGSGSPLALPRGPNRPWSDGGLLYPYTTP